MSEMPEAPSIAPYPLPDISSPLDRLPSAFRNLAIQSTAYHHDPTGIREAEQAIEERIKEKKHEYTIEDIEMKLPIPRTLEPLIDRTIRHARRVKCVADRNVRLTGRPMAGFERRSFEHTVRLLRREIVRAIRHKQLKLNWLDGATLRPNSRSLIGKSSGLATFINQVCYAATKGPGCFALSLLPLAIKPKPSDMTSWWSTSGLKIRKNKAGDLVIGSRDDVTSSDGSTDVEETVTGDELDSEEDASSNEDSGSETDEEDGEEAEEISMGEGSGSQGDASADENCEPVMIGDHGKK